MEEFTQKELEARKELMFFVKLSPLRDNFSALLYLLISKSDPQNKYKIEKAYPEEVAAWNEWQQSKDENELFMHWQKLVSA